MSKKSPKNLTDSLSSDDFDEDTDYSRVKKYQFEKCNSSPFLQASMHSWSMIQTDGDEEEAIEEDVHEDYPVINSIDNIFNNFIYRPTSMKIREGRDCEVEKFLNQDYTFFSPQPITYAAANIPEQINTSVEKVIIHLLDLSLIPRSKKSTFIHSWYNLSNYTSVEATRMVNQFIESNYKHIDKKSWEFRTEITWASTYLSQYNKYQRTQQQTISHTIRIFHYIGLGFPPPERNRIWMKDTSPTGSSSLQDLSQTFYPPCLLIFDCDKAAILKDYLNDTLVRIISKLDHNGFSIDPNISKLFFSFFACSENEQLRIASNLPQNFFTCSLLTPNRAFSAITGINVTNVPLFESLLIIFTDTIALETLTTDLFYRLFRGDSIVSNLWRRFLLAQRLMKTFGLHSQSIPDLPDMSEHQLWGQFEFSLMSVGAFNPLINLSDLYLKQFETTECPPNYVCAFVSSLLQIPDSITSNGNTDPSKKTLKEIVMSKIASFMEKSPKNCRLIASFINFKNLGDFQTYLNSKKNSFCDHCTIMSGLLLVASSILKVVNASFSITDATRICFDKHHFNDKIRVYILSILVALRDVQSRLSCFFNTENTTDKFLPLLFQSSPLLREWILLFIHSTISRFSLEIKIGSSYLHVYCMLLLAERRKLTRAAAVNILTTILIPRCFEFNRTIMSCALKAAVDGSRVVRFAFLCMAARFASINQDNFDGKINDNVNNSSSSNNGFYNCADNDVNLNLNNLLNSSDNDKKRKESIDDMNDYEYNEVEIESLNENNSNNNNNSVDYSHSDDNINLFSSSNMSLKKLNKDFELIKVDCDDEKSKVPFYYRIDATSEELGIDPNLDYIIREDPIQFAKMSMKAGAGSENDENKLNSNKTEKGSNNGFYQTVFNKSDIQKEGKAFTPNNNGFYQTVFSKSDVQEEEEEEEENNGFYQTYNDKSKKSSGFYQTVFDNDTKSTGFYKTVGGESNDLKDLKVKNSSDSDSDDVTPSKTHTDEICNDESVGSAPNLSLLLRRLVKKLCNDPYEHIRKFANQLLKNPTKSGLEELYLRNSIEVHKMAHLLLFSGSLDKSEMQQRYTDTYLSCDELELFEMFNANASPTAHLSSKSSVSDSHFDHGQTANDLNSIMEPQDNSGALSTLYKPFDTTYLSEVESDMINSNSSSIENNNLNSTDMNLNQLLSSAVVSICFDLEHNNVAAATANGFVVWGENRWHIPSSENSMKSAIHSIVPLPKLALAVAATNGYIYILRNGFYDPVDCFQPSTISPAGKTVMVAVSFDAKPIPKIEMKEKSIPFHRNMDYGQPKTTLLYIAQGNNEILVWDIEALILIKRISVPSPPTSMQIIKISKKVPNPAKLPLNEMDLKEASIRHFGFSSSKKFNDTSLNNNNNNTSSEIKKDSSSCDDEDDHLIKKSKGLAFQPSNFSTSSDNRNVIGFSNEIKSSYYSSMDHDLKINSSGSLSEDENDFEDDFEEEYNITETECFLYASLQNGSIIKINTNINEIVQINNMYKDANNDNDNGSDDSSFNYVKIGVHKNILFSVSKKGPLYFWEDFENPRKITESWDDKPALDFLVHPLFPIAIRIDDHSVTLLKLYEDSPMELQLSHSCSSLNESKNDSKNMVGTCCCFDGSRPLCAIGYDDGTVAVWRLKIH